MTLVNAANPPRRLPAWQRRRPAPRVKKQFRRCRIGRVARTGRVYRFRYCLIKHHRRCRSRPVAGTRRSWQFGELGKCCKSGTVRIRGRDSFDNQTAFLNVRCSFNHAGMSETESQKGTYAVPFFVAKLACLCAIAGCVIELAAYSSPADQERTDSTNDAFARTPVALRMGAHQSNSQKIPVAYLVSTSSNSSGWTGLPRKASQPANVLRSRSKGLGLVVTIIVLVRRLSSWIFFTSLQSWNPSISGNRVSTIRQL